MRIIKILILLFFSTPTFSQQVACKLKITYLTGSCYIYETYHDYKGSLISANAMYLVTDSGVVLFDTPWDSAQFQPLLDSIQARHQKDVVLCISTHSHADRTAGLAFLNSKGIATYSSQLTDSICALNHEKRPAFTFTRDTLFTVGNYSFSTFYGGKGHAPDNIVIWLEKDKILYGGCLVKSTEATDPGYLGDANVKAWPNTIRKIQRRFPHPAYVIPGHGSWGNKNSLNHTLYLLKHYRKN